MIVRFILMSALVLAVAGAAGAAAGPPDCTWGASSTLAWIDAAGVEHQAPVTVTGCTP